MGDATMAMKKGYRVLIGFFALAASGCFLADDPTDGGKPDGAVASTGKSFNIVMIPQNGTDVEQLSAKSGAEMAAADIAKSQGIKVNIDWQAPASPSAEDQAKVLAKASESKPAAILVSCVDGVKLVKPIDAAAEKVPVMTYQSDSPSSSRFSFYGINNLEAGQRLVRELARLTKGNIKVAVYGGDPASSTSMQRVEGIEKELAKTPQMSLVGIFHSAETISDASNEVRDQALAHPEINAWIMVGPWPLLNESMIKVVDPSLVKIVAMGCLPSELWFVQKGAVLYSETPYQMGYVAVQTIVQKVNSKTQVPSIVKYDLNAGRVKQDNIQFWAQSLNRWGFKDVPQDLLFRKRQKESVQPGPHSVPDSRFKGASGERGD